jgi:hypothetical protein
MAKRYFYKNIRALLTTGFTDEELRILCFEEPEFRAVYENWSTGAGKAALVQNLIDRAERRVQLDHLLELAKEQNSAQYKLHQPYYEGEPVEPAAASTSASETKPDPVSQPTPAVSSTSAQSTAKTASARPAELFFSYAHKDEKLRDELAVHLTMLRRQGVISAWHDRQITAGSEWANAIDDHLNSADIILLLISPDFIASDYCYDIELKRAMERHEAREAVVIPVILRPVDWTGAPFGKLQALRKNAEPVNRWSDRDEAWLNVVQGIRKVAETLAHP